MVGNGTGDHHALGHLRSRIREAFGTLLSVAADAC
jgi:hypothetical protein